MMLIFRCTSLKSDETTKRSWTAASAFLILMIVCFICRFLHHFLLVIICAGVLFRVQLFFLPFYFKYRLRFQCKVQASPSPLSVGWVGEDENEDGVGGATRNVLIHFVCSCRNWETNVEKLHRWFICLRWKLLACFTLCPSWVFWSSCVRYSNGSVLCFNLYFLVFFLSERCFLLEVGSIFALFLAGQTQGVMPP